MIRVLSVIALCGIALSFSGNLARAESQSDQQRRKTLLPQVRMATDCIAAQVANELSMTTESNLTIPRMLDRVLKRDSCFAQIRLLIDQHNRLMGPGTGEAFVNGPYLADLPRAVSARLQTASRGSNEPPSLSIASAPSQNTGGRSNESPRVTTPQGANPTLQPLVSKNAQPASATVSDRLKGIEDDDAFRKGLSLICVTLAASTVILFVLGCGSRVVVFANAGDVFMSACIFITPLVTVAGGGLIGWMLAPQNPPRYATTLDMALDNPAPTFVVCIGALVWTWSILGTIINSVRYNGFIIGLVVAVLKLGALLSLMLIWLGTLHNYDEEGNENHIAAKFFIFAILIWFASKFVNGERVMERRKARTHQRAASDIAVAGA